MNRAVANAITLASLIWGFAFAVYTTLRLPAEVAVHFGVDGTPDRFGSSVEAGFGLLLMPVVALLLNAILVYLPRLDARATGQAKVFDLIRATATLLLVVVQYAIAQSIHTQRFDSRLVMIGLGVLLIVIGNVMPKIGPNPYAGVRLPYTFASRQAWWVTNRAGGWLFVILGALLVICAAVLPKQAALYALLGLPIGLIAGLVWLMLLAKREWQRDPERQPLGSRPGSSRP